MLCRGVTEGDQDDGDVGARGEYYKEKSLKMMFMKWCRQQLVLSIRLDNSTNTD